MHLMKLVSMTYIQFHTFYTDDVASGNIKERFNFLKAQKKVVPVFSVFVAMNTKYFVYLKHHIEMKFVLG